MTTLTVRLKSGPSVEIEVSESRLIIQEQLDGAMKAGGFLQLRGAATSPLRDTHVFALDDIAWIHIAEKRDASGANA